MQERPHLFITAALALGLKGIIIPVALHRMIVASAFIAMSSRSSESARPCCWVWPDGAVPDAGPEGHGGGGSPLAREDLAFALAIILLGLLMMITRRNAVTQIVGFMSLENGLILAATGARGMPLVVEICVAFSVLIAFSFSRVFVFRIRERFDTRGSRRARTVWGTSE